MSKPISGADREALRYLVDQVGYKPLRAVLDKHGFPTVTAVPVAERPVILNEMLDAAVEALDAAMEALA